ncbi:MAG: ComEA family DNA-binding protein, partial [bacterium]
MEHNSCPKTNYLKFTLALFYLIIFPVSLFCQESIEEKLLEEQAEGSEQSELLEIILNLKEHPVNLNTAHLEQLEKIPGLPPGLRQEIIHYRQQYGAFKSKAELLMVPGMDPDMFAYLQPLITISPSGTFYVKRNKLNWRTRVSNRYDQAQGSENGNYENSPEKIYNRMQFELGDKIQGGLLLEKDSGESRWDDLSLYYLAMDITKNLHLLVGNYQLEVGQGLVLWGPYGFSKSVDSVYPIKKRGQGIKGYSAVDENAAFWGSTASLKTGPFQFITFVSHNQLDATPVTDNEVSGLDKTGFHGDETAKSKKDVISESAFGGRIQFTTPKGLCLGATYYHSSFDKLIYDPDLIRNRFKFHGQENSVLGIDWDWSVNNFFLFGEVAQSKSGGRAFITGAQIDYGAVQCAFLFRNYQKDFHNLHGFGFGETNGTTQNERGYYTGLNFKLTATTTLHTFYDIFYHPWPTYFNPLPTEGQEFLSQIEQKFGRQLQLTFRFRSKQGQETNKFLDQFQREKKEIVDRHKTQWRLQLDYRVSTQVHLRSRVEYVRFQKNRYSVSENILNEDGMMLYQEIRLQPKKQLRILGRVSFFETDSFDSGIFQYESDLPGVVTNQALLGRGNRWYLLLKYQPVKFLQFSVKYSETFRNDRKVPVNNPY